MNTQAGPLRLEGEREILSHSLWLATARPAAPWPALAGEAACDVAIVGGGYTGLSAALHLAERGISATVLESRSIGWGASGRNGGQVLPGLKEDPDGLEKLFGRELGQRMTRLAGGAPDAVFALIGKHGIECDPVRQGWLQPAHTPQTLALSARRVAQWQARGAPVQSLSREAMAARLGTDAYLGGMLDLRAGSVQPLDYARGLASAAARLGASIHEHTPVQGWRRQAGRFLLDTPNGRLQAGQILLCTNAYTPPWAGALHRSVVPVYSVQVATDPLPEPVRERVLPGRQVVSDMRRLLVYYRYDPHGRLLMGGRGAYGEGGIRRQMAWLRARAMRLFGHHLGKVAWQYQWGGYVAMTQDHFPHVHRLEQGVHAALGYNGRGVAMATELGRLLAQAAAGAHPDEMDFPFSEIRTLPLFALHRPMVGLAIAWNGLLDRLE
ncbi:FAD-binding oxidoreductase [Orrella sp. JC864]|uniref:NAD(P)/FAD-dependent oxidoreductase n=1 Tax=Orrella sp. JC864 TaxID=3120298 RepID=UPI00300917C5